jgi:endonuclease/exonuclease/phosphatase (EEP) superfamily protein YafD
VGGVVAIALTTAAIPSLAARAAGGRPPDPYPRLAALAPLATLAAFAGVAVAAVASWWLTLLLSIPALTLLAWQLPPAKRASEQTAPVPQPPDPGPGGLTLRVLTLNVMGGSADPAAVVRAAERHRVDVLVVQELTRDMVRRLADAGMGTRLPYSHLDPRHGSDGTGLWARWPLAPLRPVPGLKSAAPRALIEPVDGWPVTVTGVHPKAPVRHNVLRWQQELAAIRSALAGTDGPQVVAGDFNASRDHRPFRELLAAGFLDCADAARRRPWPGYTWPAGWGIPSVMRLDHVLVPEGSATVSAARIIRVRGTDHRGVLAVIQLTSRQPPATALPARPSPAGRRAAAHPARSAFRSRSRWRRARPSVPPRAQ